MATDTLMLNTLKQAFEYRVRAVGQPQLKLLAFWSSQQDQHAALLGQASPWLAWGKDFDVPARSQTIYPGRNGWCSPVALSMLLAYHGTEVSVPEIAAGTHDSVYDGCGNWAFNVAYAGSCGLSAYVIRLPSLIHAEPLIQHGRPLALSLAWKTGDPSGSVLADSSGHLMVLIGFDDLGNPILNDPGASNDAGDRQVYPRAEVERQWLTRSVGMASVLVPEQP